MRAYFVLCLLLSACGSKNATTQAVTSTPIAKCEAGDAAQCAELMEYADSNAEFEKLGNLACKHGDATACEFLGHTLFVRSLAPRGAENAQSLRRRSLELYQAGCRQGSGLLCAFASLLNESSPESDWKTQSLTQAACEKRSVPKACELFATAVRQTKKKAEKDHAQNPQAHTVGTFRLCLSKRGRVKNIDVLISTKHPDYNRNIFEKMRKWTYAPYKVNGKATSFAQQ
tara:strand:+ start:130226 stop:130912 length:687 start_codon:yes stop_codon:yes gene_type:complete